MKQYQITDFLEKGIEQGLQSLGLSLHHDRELAKSVLQLSDYFVNNPDGETPWQEKWAQAAYLCYYLPLNFLRVRRVLWQIEQQKFFSGLDHGYDFGAGLGTATLALRHIFKGPMTLIEKSEAATRIADKAFAELRPHQWLKSLQQISEPHKSFVIFSYSLTELSSIPEWALKSEGLILIEPSTEQDGRRLLEWRQDLLDKGYQILAPCTHSQSCPLLTHSKHDWCHDRLHLALPEWMQKIEQHLPMKNRTVTVSYLVARKKPLAPVTPGLTRVVGDLLKEKGKDRQLICQDSERKYLTWMHKHGEHPEYRRGDMLDLSANSLKVVANELRVEPGSSPLLVKSDD